MIVSRNANIKLLVQIGIPGITAVSLPKVAFTIVCTILHHISDERSISDG